MPINSIASSATTAAAIQPQNQPVRAMDAENDGDKDDGTSKVAAQNSAAQAAPQPTVNTIGQTIGSIINTQA